MAVTFLMGIKIENLLKWSVTTTMYWFSFKDLGKGPIRAVEITSHLGVRFSESSVLRINHTFLQKASHHCTPSANNTSLLT